MKLPAPTRLFPLACLAIAAALAAFQGASAAADAARDWPEWGGSSARNNVSPARNLPIQWAVGEFDQQSGKWNSEKAKNVRWTARLGSEVYGSPVVAGDRVYCATNNDAAYLSRYPATVDLGVLLSFQRTDGRLAWQYSAEKLKGGQAVDWPKVGICGCPLVEGNRLWLVNNRGEVVCLDTKGTVVWTFDMMRELGSIQRYQTACSVTAVGDVLLACTGNGRDKDEKLPAPKAPSFVALDKRSGKLLWADNSPGENILDGQWSSPTAAVLGGVPQAIFAGGDGWLYSFELQAAAGKPKLLWKFDCNPKKAVWQGAGGGDRNTIISTPVVCEGQVFIATGQDPESGEGQGDLWCIDPTKRGDVSAELVVDASGKPVPPRRLAAVDLKAGEQVKANPNSAAVWHYRGEAPEGKDKPFEKTMHRCLGMPAIHNGLLVIGDFSGLVHCLDAKTGKVHWTHDAMAAIWGTPLIAENRVYLGTADGIVLVFDLATTKNLLAKNEVGAAVHGTIAAVDGTLFVATAGHLIAVSGEKR
jgi:outer membrane protein assembly factor BamB